MTQRPDVIPVTALGEIESRIGIPPIESLLAERDALVKQVAPLRARHGFGGVWDDLRRLLRATIAMKIRAQAAATIPPTKVTEAFLEDAAQDDADYLAFIEAGVLEKVQHTELENRITGINDLIRRGDAVARYAAQEVGLSK